MSKKTWMVFVSLIILVGVAGIAYADCPSGYNSTEVGSITYCLDEDGYTTDKYDPRTTPPTVTDGFQNLPGDGKFQTPPGQKIDLIGGGSITGSGTVNSDGTISLDTNAKIITPTGQELTGDLKYNPSTKKTSFGLQGGTFIDPAAGMIEPLYFYGANDVYESDGSILGTCEKDCIIPGARMPEGGDFKIKINENGINIDSNGNYLDLTTGTELLYSQPIILVPQTEEGIVSITFPVKLPNGEIITTRGGLVLENGELYTSPELSAVYVNGAEINNNQRKYLITVTSGPIEDFTPEKTPELKRDGVHFRTGGETGSLGDYGVSVVNHEVNNPLTVRLDNYKEETAQGDLNFDMELGDTLSITAWDGSATITSETEPPTVSLKGERASVTPNAHETLLFNGKVFGNPKTEGGNSLALDVIFFDSHGNPLKDKDGRALHVEYNNVNKGSENLFSVNDNAFDIGLGGYFQSYKVTSCSGLAATGQATSFLGRAWGWITGNAGLERCDPTVFSSGAGNELTCGLLCDEADVTTGEGNKAFEVQAILGNCIVNDNNGVAREALVIKGDDGKLYYLIVAPQGTSSMVLNEMGVHIGNIDSSSMNQLRDQTKDKSIYPSYRIIREGSGTFNSYDTRGLTGYFIETPNGNKLDQYGRDNLGETETGWVAESESEGNNKPAKVDMPIPTNEIMPIPTETITYGGAGSLVDCSNPKYIQGRTFSCMNDAWTINWQYGDCWEIQRPSGYEDRTVYRTEECN